MGLIDFDKDILMKESISISQKLIGFIRYSELKNMEWDEYERLIKYIKTLGKRDG